ncbi:hypothetical protein GUJ93_ZPchr0006g46316 [Zizania palustris]|uniref:Uncharacterized protein n=1 Tax=Zizania palustris TaxID=103762 RepID=A0A8J5SNP7_ZIZPA|nr:hypothetical protein GUJ93_ZPchr0006g46316 [Zizania palustris]
MASLAKDKEAAADAIGTLWDILEHFGTSYSLAFDIAWEPLSRRLRFIQAAARRVDVTVAKYWEVSGRVAALGVLLHLEAIGGVIPAAVGTIPITFEEEREVKASSSSPELVDWSDVERDPDESELKGQPLWTWAQLLEDQRTWRALKRAKKG